MIEWFNKTLDISIGESFILTCVILFIIAVLVKYFIISLKILKYQKCPKCGHKTKVVERYENYDYETNLECGECYWSIKIK